MNVVWRCHIKLAAYSAVLSDIHRASNEQWMTLEVCLPTYIFLWLPQLFRPARVCSFGTVLPSFIKFASSCRLLRTRRRRDLVYVEYAGLDARRNRHLCIQIHSQVAWSPPPVIMAHSPKRCCLWFQQTIRRGFVMLWLSLKAVTPQTVACFDVAGPHLAATASPIQTRCPFTQHGYHQATFMTTTHSAQRSHSLHFS